jgi:hypothetical protein
MSLNICCLALSRRFSDVISGLIANSCLRCKEFAAGGRRTMRPRSNIHPVNTNRSLTCFAASVNCPLEVILEGG